jgi:hypothetical protein
MSYVNLVLFCVSVHNGWILVEKIYIPVMTSKPAAPKAILELVKCRSKKGCVTNKCLRPSNNLVSSELCDQISMKNGTTSQGNIDNRNRSTQWHQFLVPFGVQILARVNAMKLDKTLCQYCLLYWMILNGVVVRYADC